MRPNPAVIACHICGFIEVDVSQHYRSRSRSWTPNHCPPPATPQRQTRWVSTFVFPSPRPQHSEALRHPHPSPPKIPISDTQSFSSPLHAATANSLDVPDHLSLDVPDHISPAVVAGGSTEDEPARCRLNSCNGLENPRLAGIGAGRIIAAADASPNPAAIAGKICGIVGRSWYWTPTHIPP